MSVTAADVLVQVLQEWEVESFLACGRRHYGIMEALRKLPGQNSVHPGAGTRSQRRSWLLLCQTIRANSASAWPLPAPEAFICLTACMMPNSMDQTGAGDHRPPFHDLIDTFSQQDVDLTECIMDVALYITRDHGPEHVCNATHLACRSALTHHGVAHINFPVDFQSMSARKGNRC